MSLNIPILQWEHIPKLISIPNEPEKDYKQQYGGRHYATALGVSYTIDAEEPEQPDSVKWQRDNSKIFIKLFPIRHETEFDGESFSVKVSEFEGFQCDPDMIDDIKISLQQDFESLINERMNNIAEDIQ